MKKWFATLALLGLFLANQAMAAPLQLSYSIVGPPVAATMNRPPINSLIGSN